MNITAYICDNGWVALYGPTGDRIATYGPHRATQLAQLRADPTLTVTQVHVPIDPKYKDFPTAL